MPPIWAVLFSVTEPGGSQADHGVLSLAWPGLGPGAAVPCAPSSAAGGVTDVVLALSGLGALKPRRGVRVTRGQFPRGSSSGTGPLGTAGSGCLDVSPAAHLDHSE